MSDLHKTMRRYVDRGVLPGAVALVARRDDVEVVAVGSLDVDGSAPMTRDSLFRIASITKPIVAAALLALPDLDTWLAVMSRIPLLHQPGAVWLYNTASDLQGALIARASGRTLPDFLAERLLEPLGMRDTGFEVPPEKRDRFTSAYRPDGAGPLVRTDTPDGAFASAPRFASGAGGLVSTADDWLAFARLLLNGGEANGRRLLSPASVSRMTTNHLTAAQRDAGALFLEGQGWGYGGQVDVTPADPWNVPGRYGWVGGSGTTAHLVPPTGTVTILLTQVAMADPTPPPLMRDFWRCTAGG
ncbi:serine hydrolase domain-containing protein [Streptomyces collinus]|uniref:serine hydrolase domain-containing protein n=1 Tax=Streptomyces collinus TaxID=42684 RepID=UPI0033B3C788